MKRRDFLRIGSQGTALAAFPLSAATNALAAPSGTGFVYREEYLDHLINRHHPESPKRLLAIRRQMSSLELDKEVQHLQVLNDPTEHIRSIHTQEHIERIERIKTSGEVAKLAVAGALGAVQGVADGMVRNAFCALRPPGHHARNTGRPEGFCYFSTIAIAAKYAQKVHGYKRILIIDWDYHHGDGTEKFFYDDPSVLFFSTHNARAYPGTGSPSKTGDGQGEGFNINVHLECGSREYDMLKKWDSALMPKVEQFRPDFVLISAGFDSRKDDTLGCFSVSDIGFMQLTRRAMDIADTYANGRLVSLLEGGYNIEGQAKAACAHMQTLLTGRDR